MKRTDRELPSVLPVFPLPGVLLLPRGQLPLNIFEPRYLVMVDDALKGDRLIGMIQPRGDEERPALYDTGCAGRITSFEETGDGRYMIVLTGVSRFTVGKELPVEKGYRRVTPDWSGFTADSDPASDVCIDRQVLKTLLHDFFDLHGISCDWDTIDGAPDEKLVTCLCMVCPFDPGEKQALLEARSCMERAERFMTLLRMAIHGKGECGGCH